MRNLRTVLCIAPHPDDETLGCGGSLLRHAAEEDRVHWFIVTGISEADGFTAQRVASRDAEIEQVSRLYQFTEVHRTHLPTTKLDTIPKGELVQQVGRIVERVQPDTIYIPYRNDVHSDHAAVFDAAVSCSKSFRSASVKRVYAYETLSETEFGLRPDDPGFRPNLFVDISPWLEQKIEIMRLFDGEIAPFPFPRSEACLRAQAALRGSQAGVQAAEAFMILREIR